MALKTFFTIVLIFSGLFSGYCFQQLFQRRFPHLPGNASSLRRKVQQGVLLLLFPVTFAGSLWILDLGSPGISFLPFLGAFQYITSGGAALVVARFMKMNPQQKGAFFCCGFFSNVGGFGGLIAFLFFGEKGYALVPFYNLLEPVIFYGIGFSIAKSFGPQGRTFPFSAEAILSRSFKDPYIIIPLFSVLFGISMNLLKVPRPKIYFEINSVLIPSGVFLLLFSIGLGIRFRKIRYYLKESFATAVIKFIFSPILVVSTAFILGINSTPDIPVMPVVLILSFMPQAFISTIPPSLYNLDLDMANSCWFFSTASMALILPALYTILRFVQ